MAVCLGGQQPTCTFVSRSFAMLSHSFRAARWTLAFALGAGLTVLTGCGDDVGPPDKPYPVRGKVTYKEDGSPVTKGTIWFVYESGPAKEGGGFSNYEPRGQIQPDGTYQLSTAGENDGAPIGTYKVFIQEPTVEGTEGQGDQVEHIVKEPYRTRETTPLTAEVKSGSNTIDIQVEKP
jgi:hypothetical protein